MMLYATTAFRVKISGGGLSMMRPATASRRMLSCDCDAFSLNLSQSGKRVLRSMIKSFISWSVLLLLSALSSTLQMKRF